MSTFYYQTSKSVYVKLFLDVHILLSDNYILALTFSLEINFLYSLLKSALVAFDHRSTIKTEYVTLPVDGQFYLTTKSESVTLP